MNQFILHLFLPLTILFMPITARCVTTGGLDYSPTTHLITSKSGDTYFSWDQAAGLTINELNVSLLDPQSHLWGGHIASLEEAMHFFELATGTSNSFSDFTFFTPFVKGARFGSPGGSQLNNEHVHFDNNGILDLEGNENNTTHFGLHEDSGLLHRTGWLIVKPVPLPTTATLMGTGLFGLLSYTRRKKSN